MSEINVVVSETPDKYLCYKEVIIPSFVKMMQEYVAEITPLMSRYKELYRLNKDGQFTDEITVITETAKSKKKEILGGHINEKIYISPYDTVPSRFNYFDTECNIKFIMKSIKKAVVISQTTDNGSYIWHKFEFRTKNDVWMLDKMFFSYQSENGPYKSFSF